MDLSLLSESIGECWLMIVGQFVNKRIVMVHDHGLWEMDVRQLVKIVEETSKYRCMILSTSDIMLSHQ